MNLCRLVCSISVAWLALVGPGGGNTSRADVFLLQNGGRIQGTWINRHAQTPLQYEIRTSEGGKLVLEASQVRQAIVQDADVEEFNHLLRDCPDTVDDQWQLAEWCRTHRLRAQREVILRHILELNPDHSDARHALGYSQVRGQWVTRQDIQRRRGYQKYDGRWRLSQEVALIERTKAAEQAEKRWLAQLRTWREMLATEDARQAYQNIAAVRDPHSVNALAILLKEEPFRQVKLLYIEVLAEIGTPAALETLFQTTLDDVDIEVFHASLDEIVRLQPPHVARQYVEVLKDEDNMCVNRAAHALGRLDDTSVLSPLIDALTTTHYIVIPKQTDNYTSTFVNPGAGASTAATPMGGTSFSAGSEAQVLRQRLNNQEVLESLIKLSGGVNFGFDRQAWRFWLANENKNAAPSGDLRRASGPGASINP